eukprot:jgi/Botrbrau1/5474/Bobra.27_1s0024.4
MKSLHDSSGIGFGSSEVILSREIQSLDHRASTIEVGFSGSALSIESLSVIPPEPILTLIISFKQRLQSRLCPHSHLCPEGLFQRQNLLPRIHSTHFPVWVTSRQCRNRPREWTLVGPFFAA